MGKQLGIDFEKRGMPRAADLLAEEVRPGLPGYHPVRLRSKTGPDQE